MRPKHDANHAELTGYYIKLGATVVDTAIVGGGYPDAVIGYRGIDAQVEFKTKRGRLLPKQIEHAMTWRGRTPRVVRCLDDVVDHIAELGAEADRRA